MSQPIVLTDEQRDQLLRATAGVTAAVQAYATALLPAIQAAAAQFRQLSAALQAAGYLDEDGRPLHQGGNAEDCPACSGTNPDYPFICPGPAPAFEERATKPTHPDGTVFGHAEMVAGGWEHCDYCRTWGRGWTPETPHACPTEPKAATS